MREWLIDNGEWGLAMLMFLQNIFPLLPSEVIMPLAGFLASIGILDMKTVVLAGLLGSLLGHLPWYFLGFALGEERLEAFVAKHGHWIRLDSAHVRKAGEWFDRHSIKAVLLGRLVPGLRTYVNIPAGTMRMAFLPYLAFTVIGDAVWTALLAYGGYALGRDYHLIASYMHLLVWILASGAAILTAWMYIRHHRQDGRTA
ncbi:MAG TPA: DedA family protein [Fibrobacteria bacterium]|nr:DedA family protein [Fibrobacteria bacterium]